MNREEALKNPIAEELILRAEYYKWEFLTFQEDIKMLSVFKPEMRINIYTTTMTVATCLDHPKKGKTQMFRRKVDIKTMNKIFRNPRLHTDLGYRKK